MSARCNSGALLFSRGARRSSTWVESALAAALESAAGLQAHRESYVAAIRALHAEGRMARTWPLRYLIRHTAYHTLDHAWEMEDRDLTGK